MKPLSAINYYKSNFKRFITIFLAVALSVSLLYTVQMLITSSTVFRARTYIQPHKYYTSITAKSKVLDSDLIDNLLSHEQLYEKAIPWVFHYTNIESIIEGSVGCKVLTVKQEDMKLLLSRMNLKLIKGRLPAPGTNEIVLHRLVAVNKGLGIGDKIGSSLQKNEIIQGEKVIVGLLEGESIVSFDSLEYWMMENNVEQDDYSLGMILLHGRETDLEIERLLNSLDTTGLDVRTLSSETRQYNKDLEGINIILSLIAIFVIIIVAVCTSFANYIYSLFRRREFGILSAIGYTHQAIENRIFREIIVLNTGGLIVGIAISVITGALTNYFIFMPSGQLLLLVRPEYFVKVSCVPLFSSIFSILPVWRMFRKLDPITVIEGID